MLNKLILFTSILILYSCNKDDDSENDRVLGLWKISSIDPLIDSNPNYPDCRMLNDQIFFNELGDMYWNYPKPDLIGTFNQPCNNGHESSVYNYTVNGNSITLKDSQTNLNVEWTLIINDNNSITITRPNSVTIYSFER
jgi:hypothetical protein